MSKFILIIILACMAVLPLACTKGEPPFECKDTLGCVTVGPGEPVKIGVLQSLSKNAASFGTEQLRAIKLAVAHCNEELLGHPIRLQIEDAFCTPEGGANAALRIIADPQSLGIIGTTCSGAAATAGKIISDSGLVMMSGNNIAPSLTSIGKKQGENWHRGYFRTIYNGSEQGRSAALFAFKHLGISRAATINDGDPLTQGLTDMFEQTFSELGGKILLSTSVNKGDTNMKPVLISVANSGADLLFFPLFLSEGIEIVRQIKEIPELFGQADAENMKRKIILMAGGTLAVPGFINAVGEDGKGIYFVSSAPPNTEANEKLKDDYQKTYGEDPSHVTYSYAYDATNLLLASIEAVAVKETDGTLHIGREALRNAIYHTSGFQGVTGKLTCNDFGDCGFAKFDAVRLDNPEAGIEALKLNIIYTYTSGG